jgi:hypothetical protein
MSAESSPVEDLYGPKWTAVFTRLAASKYGHMTDPVQLMEDARQQMALSVERRFSEGHNAFSDAYLVTAYKHSLIDAFRSRSGRPGPRSWLKAFGDLGRWLYERYCLQGCSRSEIQADASVPQDYAAEQLTALLDEMDRVRECETARRAEYSLEDEAGANRLQAAEPTPEQQLAREQAEAIQANLFQSGLINMDSIRHFQQQLRELASEEAEGFRLDNDQVFIIQATLDGKLTETRMGELLGGLSVRQVRYRRQKAIETMAEWLNRRGLELSDLLPDVEGS